MLELDQPAPPFALPDQDDRQRSLEELLADGPIVLYFYPGDFTPVCTKQACTFRDGHEPLAEAGLRVVGISAQSPDSHRRFRERYGLPFTLLSDPKKQVIRAYHAAGPLGLLTRRVSYLIDPAGVIRDRVQADLRLSAHRDFLTRVQQRIRAD